MSRKLIVLGLALLLPVLFFLILKFFGKNQFDVPPLYEAPNQLIESDCGKIQFPYALDDEIRASIVGKSEDSFVVIVFAPTPQSHDMMVQLNRVIEQFEGDPLGFRLISSSTDNEEGSALIKSVTREPSEVKNLMRCVFFLRESEETIVIDNLGRIRGHYDLDYLEDADRLILELEILFEKY